MTHFFTEHLRHADGCGSSGQTARRQNDDFSLLEPWLIQKRQPYAIDLVEVFEAAASQGVMMEINAFPDRLDLDDVNCRAAMERGVMMSIGTDAHALNQLDFLPMGVSVARRGWLEAKDVANTLSLKELLRAVDRG